MLNVFLLGEEHKSHPTIGDALFGAERFLPITG